MYGEGFRNNTGLTCFQIRQCQATWRYICNDAIPLHVEFAGRDNSKTYFDGNAKCVFLGADAYQGIIRKSAQSRMSHEAVLAHEWAHYQRCGTVFERDTSPPAVFLDEAEASIHASFSTIPLSAKDRYDLVEHAFDLLGRWL
jgi:hypothetical protein